MEEMTNITNPSNIMISFVVPVYNVEKTLDICVKSLLVQKTSFEIILVNDGSTDNSGAMCDGYAKNDKRIVTIHEENGGLSIARNTGLSRACGKYIWFVDSDDWIESNAAEVMLEAAELYKAQVVVCGRINDYIDTNHSFTAHVERSSIYKGKEELARAIYEMDKSLLLQFVTNKMYRRDFIIGLDVQFEDTRMPVEDVLFNLSILPEVETVFLIADVLYHYIQYPNVGMVRKYSKGLYSICQHVNTLRRIMYRDLHMTSETCLDCCARACFYQDLHAIVNMYRTMDDGVKPIRIETWERIFDNADIRDEVRRCKRSIPEARIVSFALFLGTPKAANAFFRFIMAIRYNSGSLYRILRDRILLSCR